jgi:MMPL family
LMSGRPSADNDESVALGLARTGRVVTAAALVMSISFAALIAAQVALMRMFGVGLTLAVLVDATLVRILLVPAFMHVLGRANWWAPKPMARLHAWFGISEASTHQDAVAAENARLDELRARADQQHKWVVRADPLGTYGGEFPTGPTDHIYDGSRRSGVWEPTGNPFYVFLAPQFCC